MPKKLIAFDLDGTLAPSKSPMPDRISNLLGQLLEKYHVCVISGGKFEQFEKQLLGNLVVDAGRLEKMHIMPTCGTRYYHYDTAVAKWEKVYAEDFTEAEKKKIIDALKRAMDELNMWEDKVYGEVIEDRGSQITLSTLGQDIVDELGLKGVEIKEAWDADNKKKQQIRDAAAEYITEFEVRVGGLTSIDVTKPGIDKAYGMRKLMAELQIGKEEILFVGDRLMEGGNDYPVKTMGIDTIPVRGWEDTALIIETLVKAF